MWVLARYFPLLTVVPDPWNRLGWFVMACAAVTPVAALIRFRRARTTVNPHKPEEAAALVITGVYAWTRNPMYLGLSVLYMDPSPLASTPFSGDEVRLLTYIRPQGDLDQPRSGHDGLFARRLLIASPGFAPVDIPRLFRRRFDLFAIARDARNRGG
jgi:hypothetical protein